MTVATRMFAYDPNSDFFDTKTSQVTASSRSVGAGYSINNMPRFLSPSRVFIASNKRVRCTSHGW
jgi:hypothetical protein